jgi:hypothetical protein
VQGFLSNCDIASSPDSLDRFGRAMTQGVASHIPFVAGGSYPVRSGNGVRPLIDGVPAFRRIAEAVASARRNVGLNGSALCVEQYRRRDHAGLNQICQSSGQR